LKNKDAHSGRVSGHNDTEEDVDGDCADNEDSDPNQIPREAFFILGARARRSKNQG
jgi:hypothetical protein